MDVIVLRAAVLEAEVTPHTLRTLEGAKAKPCTRVCRKRKSGKLQDGIDYGRKTLGPLNISALRRKYYTRMTSHGMNFCTSSNRI